MKLLKALARYLSAATLTLSMAHAVPAGTAIDLDASGDYVEIPDSPSLSPTQQLSLEAWIRPTGSGWIVTKHQGDGGGFNSRSFSFQLLADNRLRAVLSHDGSAGNAIDASSSGALTLNTWSHAAIAYDGTTLKFYLNGVQIGSASGAGGINDGPLPVRIGLFTPSNPSFNGEIDEVRIWSTARTQEEIRQGMFAVFNGNEAGLEGYWRFENQDATDTSVNGNNGALLGDPQWTQPGAPCPRGTAMDLDPGSNYVSIPDSPSLSPTQQLTLEAWIMPQTTGAVIIGKYQGDFGGVNTRSYIFEVAGAGDQRLSAVISHDGSDSNIISAFSTDAVSFNVWAHVALTYDGAVLKFYINGVNVGSANGAGGIHDSPLPVHLGIYTIQNLSMDGVLDEVRIWSATRTEAEIRQDMFAELSGNEVGLEGYWRFENQDATDSSANGNDGAVLGTPLWLQPGAPGIVGVGTVPVSVSLPDVTGTYNEILAIPVSLGDATGLGLVAAEVFVCYDGDVLLPTANPVSSTSATANWSIEHNIAQGSGTPIDTLKIAMADEVALSGDGDVLGLNFTVADLRTPTSSVLSFEHVLFNDGTPVNAPTNGSFTLTGNDGSIASAPATIIPRQTIAVTVDEPDEDRTINADQLTVQIANGAQTETLILDESGAQTGLFTGSINTIFALTAVSGDGTIQAQAGDVIVFSYDDLLDGNGNTVPRADQTNVIGGTDGSLRVTIVSQPGDTVRVRVTDSDLNTDPNQQETTTVTTVNNTTNESETITLTELDIDDEIFFGIVETTPGAVAGTDDDGTFNAQEGDELVATYDDTLLANGGTDQLTDTNFVVDPFGDTDDNGSTQAFDAAKVLLHVLSPFLTGLDSLSANLDLLAFDAINGKITPFDASLILQKRVGLIGRFPVQEDEADNHPQPETDNSVPKRILDQRLLTLQPMHGYLAVVADERSGILSGDVLVRGNVERVQIGEEMQHFLSASRAGEEGLRLVFAGAREVSGPGELLRIYAGVGPERVQLIRASFNDGRIVARLEGVAALIAVPQAYALYANHPNPFNPETAIRFSLPQAEVVRLEVFDVLGQRVRILAATTLAAGTHEVKWDGRNEQGVAVGNGIYIYRLQAGDFAQVRRMLLLK